MAILWLAWPACGRAAETSGTGANDPQARFRGPLTYDFGVTNVKWEAATPEYSYVVFDLRWSYSWRAKWTEPAKTSATGKDIELESWDAAWVFVKFLPEKDSDEAKERNHWLHAALDKDPANHVMPAGATNFVKVSDDGARGMGLFFYRDAVGHGVNDWKNIKLRWNHGSDSLTGLGAGNVDPAKAEVKVHAIAMVYVPEGAFKVGTGRPSGNFQPFADGPDMPSVMNMQNIRSKDQEFGGLTDGAWRGGNSIPMLLDAEWNSPAKQGTRARRIGNAPGELWGTFTYHEVNLAGTVLGAAGAFPDSYPTGYEPFYCMKYDLTQGQYVDFLNSLPPDVAAERAIVGSEISADYGIPTAKVNLPLGPGQEPWQVVENAGCTIYSSADIPERVAVPEADSRIEDEEKNPAMDALLDDLLSDKKGGRKKGSVVAQQRPVYAARLPFRRLPGAVPSDVHAYAVWAGLRPMSGLERFKAENGARDPVAPPDWTPPKDRKTQPLLDEGLPTERYQNPEAANIFGMAPRVGIFSTPTSDRGTARASYWGISELDVPFLSVISVQDQGYCGTHGNGITSPGRPGASFKRTIGNFTNAPPDWTKWWTYIGGHFEALRCRLVVSADNRIRKSVDVKSAQARKPKPSLPIPPVDGRQDDWPQVSNVRVEPGKEFSTVSFDLAWNNSWRVKWTEPAEKNCTGKPLALENWDAVWVFVKFQPKAEQAFSHATLSPDVVHHVKPAGGALEMGLSDDPSAELGAGGKKGMGVFIYRDAVGQGANDFKGIKLRWESGADQADPVTAEISVHAIAMVYVPEGPFRSLSPFIYQNGGYWTPDAYVCKLMTIDTPDATKPSGHSNFSTNYARVGSDFPNGYGAFYCMKYAVSQGEYARFLTEMANNDAGIPRALYGRNGNTILYSAGEGLYEAEVPERPAKFLGDWDIYSFVSWVGLRPATCLEYEKACRGPRAAARDEDVWAAGACAPADGLAKFVPSLAPQAAPANRRLIWPSPSYWGIRDLSQSGALIEWPAVVREDGRIFAGNHGTGSTVLPPNWPLLSRCEWYALGMLQGYPLSEVGIWLLTEDYDLPLSVDYHVLTRSRIGRYGAIAVRTAARGSKDAPLQVEALPNLDGFNIVVVYLSGKYRNDGDQPLKVELVSPLPAAFFLQGAASRFFTAAAKSVTPFKVPVVLSGMITNVTARRGWSLFLPVQVRNSAGEVLAEAGVTLPLDILKPAPPTIQSLDGGKIDLKVTNATESAVTLAFEMPSSPAVTIGESSRRLTVPAGAIGAADFPVPRQAFPKEGVCAVPYRVTVGNGPVLAGLTSADLRLQTRWWFVRRIRSGPQAGESGLNLSREGQGEIDGLDEIAGGEDAVFKAADLPKGWTRVTAGSSLTFTTNEVLTTHDSVLAAATRVDSPSERDAVVKLIRQGAGRFLDRVWVNQRVVYERQPPPRSSNPNDISYPTVKPFRMNKGMNTVVVELHSRDDSPVVPGSIALEFCDPKSGQKQTDLMLEMERK